ncbi:MULTISPECIES: hypothetical protein [Exiguobacterium]|uniref:hypothetical protein n=1 Tax=Exiguobacterium TaxID=33986 RepID=UPI00040A2EDC|nr:hypothetical protein [Exiguobacterium sp. ZOR0005]
MDFINLIQQRAVPLLVLTLFVLLNFAFLIAIWKKRSHYSNVFLVSATTLAIALVLTATILMTFTVLIGYND